MMKRKRPSKVPLQAIENKNVNNADTTDNMSIRKNKKCKLSQQYQKQSTKRILELKDTKKSQQNSENLNVPSKQNVEMYDYRIEQLNLISKQLLHCPTLTQDELRILFTKYKYDGHYKPNKSLPPFESLSKNKWDTLNNINCSLQTQQSLECNSYEQQEINSEKTINRSDDKYHCIQSSCIDIKNYNHTLTDCDTQSFGNRNIFNNTQNIDESRSNFCINEISNIQGDYFPRNMANTENIYPEEQRSYQYENFVDITENSQQSENYPPIHFDVPQNPNMYTDFHVQKWDNSMSLTEGNNNYQVSQSEHLIHVPEIIKLEWYYSTKNAEEQNIFNTNVHETVYPVMNNDYDTINNSTHIKQNFYANSSHLSSVSDNSIPDINSLLSSSTSIVD
nr:flap endonuclease 1-like [Nomia melanderi]XP_031827157.1 flap endonuclease 1-like [Nomia melanderi]